MANMRRHYITIALATLLLVSSCHRERQTERQAPTETFTVEVLLKSTPLKRQGNGALCWLYAMLSTIETEHIMRGDSINLSAVFLAKHLLADEARLRYASGGKHDITLRGMATKTFHLLQQHGAMPFSSFRPSKNIDYKGLSRQMQRTADNHRAHRKGIGLLDAATGKILEEAMGPAPSWVFMLGCQYTPLEFAHSIYTPKEYVALTSFTHHPFGTMMVLEVPDNHYCDAFLNVPIDSMIQYVEHALRSGHPVCWEGDISEPGYDAHAGVARLTGKKAVTQESRQQAFDRQQTTDDHCLAIIGIARDKKGKKLFVCKDSWGNNLQGGLMFLDEDYVKAKTIAVVIPAAALPTADQLISHSTSNWWEDGSYIEKP